MWTTAQDCSHWSYEIDAYLVVGLIANFSGCNDQNFMLMKILNCALLVDIPVTKGLPRL